MDEFFILGMLGCLLMAALLALLFWLLFTMGDRS